MEPAGPEEYCDLASVAMDCLAVILGLRVMRSVPS